MLRLHSVKELKEFREIIVRDANGSKPRVVICAGTACQASGSNAIIRAAKRHILQQDLLDKVAPRITGCHGFCEMGPFILTEPQRAFYHKVTVENVSRIIDATIAGEYVEELLYSDPNTGERYYRQDDIPFFKKQQRTILGKNQRIDPIRIHDYIAADGYRGLERALSEMSPAEVINAVKASGLRGRGGAGFPTGFKWELLAGQPYRGAKYLVCNADEGDPGAYMDRSLLEGSPHSVIEGMTVGAYATGASGGVVYVRNEYPVAIKHLVIALRQAREMGLLGQNILGSGLSFDIHIVRGAGAFVCGEETALIRSIEGEVGEPRQRPPFPVEKGIHGRPTAINNVETWCNIPVILEQGPAAFARIGIRGNSGTKIFSLVGKIKNTGLVEVPMGMSIRENIYEIGGGPAGDSPIKAVQTGGPSGGCIPARLFDLPIDYDSLAEAGSIMGSGGMIVMDEDTCMVDVAKYFMNFLKDESCGKCFTCRKGTQRMYEILEDISEGRAVLDDLDLLEELALAVKDSTMCGLGQSAPNPVLSTLKYFREEYERHIRDKSCDAFVCSKLVGVPCQAACPLGTEVWRYVALIEKGDYEGAYRVIRETNPFPSVCARVCDHACESQCRLGKSGSDPVAIRELKHFVTDTVDPSVYRPRRTAWPADSVPHVAVVGSGPAGLTVAHYLSLRGCKVTVFEKEREPGGMLICGIPAYRLSRDVLAREVESLLDANVTLRCNAALGRDFTLDGLFEDGCQAVFLATGAHVSRTLGIEGEDAEGVCPAMRFLKSHNLHGNSLAKGRVAIIGGGNSTIDAARVAIRQEEVESVTILYRRTEDEMPAYDEEIEAARSEGVGLVTMVTPVRIASDGGRLVGVELVRNEPGDFDASGRRRPVPVPGTEFGVPLDTLIVAISEAPDQQALSGTGLEYRNGGTLATDGASHASSREGVFAGGDLVTGPNSVVAAIAAGKRAAQVIERYLRRMDLQLPPEQHLPDVHIPPRDQEETEEETPRTCPPELPVEIRRRSFSEVVQPFSAQEARGEARRCLRCDLEFTEPVDEPAGLPTAEGGTAC
ncbi:MAG: FAD-dependent oxidoreductase [Planctomycetota bacterium]|jgi:NADH-quinone oxidoreductase subunit F